MSNRNPSTVCARIVFGVLLMAISLIAAVIGVGLGSGLRINMTPSEPLGLWRIRPLDRAVGAGDLVFICPPQTQAMRLAWERGYLRSGLCPGGYAPLIKTVAAIAGQSVAIGRSVVIDGVTLPRSALAQRDGNGRPLVPYSGGAVPIGEVFLHSGFVGSYDSRYFGPFPAAGILGFGEEVFTYAP